MSAVVDLGTLDHRLAGLQRPAQSRFTSGLCRAIAERTGLDPLVVRIIAIALTFAAGLGIALYAWGTLLTPRVGRDAPIRRLVPAFERWSTKTQLMVIIISTLVVVITAASTSSVPLGPAVIIISLVLLARRRGNQPGQPGGPLVGWAPPSTAGSAAAAPPRSVEEWRTRLRTHAVVRNVPGDPLPVVDLYGPDPEPAPPPRTEPARVSWLGALAVVGIGVTAGFGTILLAIGTQPVLMAMAACTLAVGMSMLLWSLLIRSRRLPTLLILVVLVGGAITAGTALQHATPPEPAVAVQPENTGSDVLTYEFVADGSARVDLSGLPLDAVRTVNVEAVASTVVILLPGAPAEQTTESVMSSVRFPEPTSRTASAESSAITLNISAVASQVTVEYP